MTEDFLCAILGLNATTPNRHALSEALTQSGLSLDEMAQRIAFIHGTQGMSLARIGSLAIPPDDLQEYLNHYVMGTIMQTVGYFDAEN